MIKKRMKKKSYVERMMRAFDLLVEEGFLVPVLDAQGQPVRENGDIVYELTKDPLLLAEWKQGPPSNN